MTIDSQHRFGHGSFSSTEQGKRGKEKTGQRNTEKKNGDIQTDKLTHIQTDRQIDRQIDRQKERHRQITERRTSNARKQGSEPIQKG